MQKNGKVFLIGAGCGNLDLITLKGYQTLLQADVVVYDSLISSDFLEILPQNCEKICAGKRFSQKSMPQEEINALLIEKAKEGKTVVRLKGGDPYVFGRGAEEMTALNTAGIDCEEIPGITSAIAVPASAGIPLTHRQVSRSATILTASSIDQEGNEKLTEIDFEAIVKLGGTIVILMGLHHLEEICARFIEAKMDIQMPCAVISNGCSQLQKTVRGTVQNIAGKVKEADLKAPAVIVFGQCACMDLSQCKKRYTAGVCGTESFSKRLTFELEKAGAEVSDFSFLNTVTLTQNLPDLKKYDWLVFTSPNGVFNFFEKLKNEKIDLRNILHLKIASIGTGTSKKLEEYGFFFDLMPEIYDSVHLGQKLAEVANADEKILICRAENGSEDLTAELSKANLDFTDFSVYELVEDEKKKSRVFENPINVDYLVFGSAYGVKTFFENLKTELPSQMKFVCIGEKCAQTLKEYNIINSLIAEEYNIEGIVSCIEEDFSRKV